MTATQPTWTIVAALAANGVMGRDNDLPWKLPEDMAHFMRTTSGGTLIMGRRTYDSMGVALKDRRNIVLSRDANFAPADATVVRTLAEAVAQAGDVERIFIIGGAKIYHLTMPYCHQMILTHIDGVFAGDTYFPEVDYAQWKLLAEQCHPADDRHAHSFRICFYQRIGEPEVIPQV